MALRPDSGRHYDSAVLSFLVGLLLFLSPLTFWWASTAKVWYLPYLLWLGWIVVIAWAMRRLRHDV